MDDYDAKVDRLERMLNDPDVAMQPDRVWSLLAEISQHPSTADLPLAGTSPLHTA